MARILVADDSATMRAMAQDILQEAAHEVHLVENGLLAFRFVERHRVDVVVLDIFMPEMDGLEAIKAIKALQPETPIITMSSGGVHNDLRFLRMARGFGAFECLRKPFEPQALRTAVDQALRGTIRMTVATA
jgi:two-component system chemotaxis response regulator CheY